MNTTNGSEELAAQIEQVVGRHVAQIQHAIALGIERAFGPLSASNPARPTRPKARTARREQGRRRSSSEIADLSDRLCALVRARPGMQMAEFAAELGLPARVLHRPMALLLSANEVRSVGQRSQTRYFPMVAGKHAG
jgi:predicted exporter